MKLLGITDSITTCDCCGKTNLKKTFVCQNDNGNINYYGCDCYARLMGIKPKDARIKIDGFTITSAGRIKMRKHAQEFYTVWCAGKLIEIIPITRHSNIDTLKIVLNWQKKDIEEWNKDNKKWYMESNSTITN